VVEERTSRPPLERLARAVLSFALPRTRLFGALFAAGRLFRPALPAALKKKIPGSNAPTRRLARTAALAKMLALAGCVQPVLAPDINAARRGCSTGWASRSSRPPEQVAAAPCASI